MTDFVLSFRVWLVKWRAKMSMPGILECSLSLKEKPTAVCDKNKPFFVRRGQWTVVNNVRAWQMHALNSCVNAIKRQMDPRTAPALLPLLFSVLLTTPCQALKLDLLVAW